MTSRRQRILIPILGALIFLLNANCTSFRGMGEFQPGAHGPASVGPTDTPASPALSWNGERRVRGPSQGEVQSPVFEWPVADIRMSRGFLYGARAHWGLDLANRKGTPILAAERGTIIYTGMGFRGYGKLIVIEHNNEWATLYAHLDKISVKEGQVVQKGQKLGGMGRTGRSSGVHLHFEVRYRRQPVNPLAYLPDTPKFASLGL